MFTNKIIRFFGGLFFLGTTVFSQQIQPLKQVLNMLSKQYNVSFSYNETVVNSLKVTPVKTNSLTVDLEVLAMQTFLVFQKVDATHYLLRKPTSEITSVCGTLVNAVTQKEAPFVALHFDKKQVYTDAEGNFTIPAISKEGFIRINSLMYQPKTISIGSFALNKCKRIEIEEAVNDLQEIVITNYLTKGFTKKTEGSIVLNPKKLGILPGVIEPDVLQTLQLIPGIQSPNETASGLHIRGSTPDQNLVLYDGMKMYNFSHFFGLISAFNPYITNSIKLYRSGADAKYGNNVGGVLDIDIENKIPTKTSLGFGTTFTHSDVYAKLPLLKNKLGVVVSARRSVTDFINSVTYETFSDAVFQNTSISNAEDENIRRITKGENTFFYEDYHSKIIFKPTDKHLFSVSLLYNQNDLKFLGTNPPVFNNVTKDHINTKNKGAIFSWKYQINPNVFQKIAASDTQFYKNYDGSRDRTSVTEEETLNVLKKENFIEETSLDYLLEYNLPSKNKVQFGYQYTNYKVGYQFFRDVDNNLDDLNDRLLNKAKNHAVFGTYHYKKQKNWLFNLGTRLQYFSFSKKAFLEPRLNVNYKLNKHFNFKFSSALKHQSIGQVVDFRNDELGGLYDRFWTLSDGRNLALLKSRQTSFGVDYQKNDWMFNAEVYQKNIDGIGLLIDENIKAKKNFSGTNLVRGLDILVKKKWGNYNTWVSYSLSKSNYQFDDLNDGEKFNGSFDVPHNLIWSHNYTVKNFEFSLGWRFRSGIPYTLKEIRNKTPNSGVSGSTRARIHFEDLNTQRLPNYQRFDFSTSYKFSIHTKKKIKGICGITFQNITNRKNILNRDYEIQVLGTPNNQRQNLATIDRISLGFVPNAMFRVNF